MENPFDLGRMRARWVWIRMDLREAKATKRLVLLLIVIHGLLSLLSIPQISRQFDRPSDQIQHTEDGRPFFPEIPVEAQRPAERPRIVDDIYLTGGISRSGLLAGKIWQLVTHAFLHANLLHLIFNVLALLMAGLQLERIVGSRGLLKIFMAGAVCGGIAHVLLQPGPQANVTLVGASGGIAAMFFWLITVSPDTRSRYLLLSWRHLGALLLAVQVSVVALLWLPHTAPALGALQIGHACHLGGSLCGWWLARRTLRPSVTREELEKQRAKREARLLKAKR